MLAYDTVKKENKISAATITEGVTLATSPIRATRQPMPRLAINRFRIDGIIIMMGALYWLRARLCMRQTKSTRPNLFRLLASRAAQPVCIRERPGRLRQVVPALSGQREPHGDSEALPQRLRDERGQHAPEEQIQEK